MRIVPDSLISSRVRKTSVLLEAEVESLLLEDEEDSLELHPAIKVSPNRAVTAIAATASHLDTPLAFAFSILLSLSLFLCSRAFARDTLSVFSMVANCIKYESM